MDDCGDSYGEDDEMLGVSDVTCQLAAAGWQNGVHPFLFISQPVQYLIIFILPPPFLDFIVPHPSLGVSPLLLGFGSLY